MVEDGHVILTTPNKRVANALDIKGDQPIESWLAIDELTELLSDYFKIQRIYTSYFEPVCYKIRNHYWLYYHIVEPILRMTKSGLYTVILASKKPDPFLQHQA